MTWVKLCGLRTTDDVGVAADAGADAIGIVLAPNSPRVVGTDLAAELIAASTLPAYLVTVDTAPDELVRLVRATGAAGAQPHGSRSYEAAAAIREAGGEVLFPIPVVAGTDLSTAPTGTVPLLDTAAPGTGRMVDQELLSGQPRSGTCSPAG